MSELTIIEKALRLVGVSRIRRGDTVRYLAFPADFQDVHIQIHRRVEKFTMTRPERTYALCEAVKYLVSNEIKGAFVECGVWRGGSVMAMALALQHFGDVRHLHLFDTFEGMPAPSDYDVSVSGRRARDIFDKRKRSDEHSDWDYAPMEDVKNNVYSTGVGAEYCHFVKGRVEDTIPEHAPAEIALLRLDTDFYESTKHELIHLFPRLVPGGVILIDDYGHWQGARKAVDEYFDECGVPVLLNRVDFAARIAVKS